MQVGEVGVAMLLHVQQDGPQASDVSRHCLRISGAWRFLGDVTAHLDWHIDFGHGRCFKESRR